jgi:hypothetical protein
MTSGIKLRFARCNPDKSLRSGSPWLYIGHDHALIKKWRGFLGLSTQVKLGQQLESTASDLRSCFVEWIGRIASHQRRIDRFWMLTFSSRSPEASPLFEQICLLYLALSKAAEYPNLLIIAEDPWLYRILARHIGVDNACSAGDRWRAEWARSLRCAQLYSRVFPARAIFLARGACRILLARLLRLSGPQKADDDRNVGLVSYAFPAKLKGGDYVDPFFGELPSVIDKLGRRPLFIFPLHTPSRLFFDIAKTGSSAVLAAWASARDLIRSCLSLGKIEGAIPNFKGPNLNIDATVLIRHELLEENASNRFVLNLWQLMAWRRFGRHAGRAFGSVIHIFENHPWEKGLNYGLSFSSIKRAGYQHSTVPSLLMNYIPGGPSERPFHPQQIIANSPDGKRTLVANGWDSSKIVVGGALRYLSSQNPAPPSITNPKIMRRDSSIVSLYVVMPGVPSLARIFMSELREFALTNPDVHFYLKFHPSVRLNPAEYNSVSSFELTESGLSDAQSRVDAVLFVSSTLGLEATLMGMRTYRYIPEGTLTLDPIPPPLHSRVGTCNFQSLGEVCSGLRRAQGDLQPIEGAQDYLYWPISPEAWKQIIETPGTT